MPNPRRTIANVQPPPAPADAGNQRAVTHGATSALLILPEAEALVPDVLAANPHLDDRRDGAAVRRYAVLLARIARVYAWLDDRDDAVFADAAKGDVHAVYEALGRWERQASRDEERLAIAPLTRARLGLDQLRGHELIAAFAGMREAAELGRRRIAELEAQTDGQGAT